MFGNCGTCAAFIAATDEMRKIPGKEKAGVCAWRPPLAVPVQVQIKPTPGNPGGVGLGAQALRPPVREDEGCAQWQAKQAANLQ